VPPAQLRELRLIARQRQKLVGLLSSEKNRMHKVLTDAGLRLGVVVSDIHGRSARAMIKGILRGHGPHGFFNSPVDVSKPAARNCTMPCRAN
jgi:transposase